MRMHFFLDLITAPTPHETPFTGFTTRAENMAQWRTDLFPSSLRI